MHCASIYEIRSATRFESVAEIRRANPRPTKVKPSRPEGVPHASPGQAIDFRRSLGLTQREMAERFGLARGTVANGETGKKVVPEVIRMAMLRTGYLSR